MRDKRLRLEILEKMSTLAAAGFGLVAALAWNSAIQDLFAKINFFGKPNSLLAKFIYAAVITASVVLITYNLGRATRHVKKEMGIEEDDIKK